jgi:hypothetical protein
MTEKENQNSSKKKEEYNFTNVIADSLPEWSLEPPQVFVAKKKINLQGEQKDD